MSRSSIFQFSSFLTQMPLLVIEKLKETLILALFPPPPQKILYQYENGMTCIRKEM